MLFKKIGHGEGKGGENKKKVLIIYFVRALKLFHPTVPEACLINRQKSFMKLVISKLQYSL